MMRSSARACANSKSVLVVDDHPVVRRGICSLIGCSTGHEVIGEAGDGFDALEFAAAEAPDIVVIDLSMPRLGGMEAIGELCRLLPGVEIEVFTLHRGHMQLAEAIAHGARAYVCKTESEHLIPAIEAVARHEPYISPAVRETATHDSGGETWDRRPLTVRERQVVKLVAEGRSNKQIARMLGISVKTTETHRSAAMRKTGTNTVTGLTLYAARNGLVEL
jgi:DNA-binding NarL/FixJ family response regulator